MKSKEELEYKIKSTESEIEDLYQLRTERIDKYGGISQTEYEDILRDIITLSDRVKTLSWVLE